MVQATVIVSYAPYKTLPVAPTLARQMLKDNLVVETCEVGVYNLGVETDTLWAYLRENSR